MDDIQKSLLESFGILANNATKKSPNTITVEAEILNVEDFGLNSYKVEYMNNKFVAYANTQSVQYTKGDKVYILVPNGDFSKEKIILGTVKPKGNVFTTSSSDATYHLEKSDNLFKNVKDISLCSYRTENINIELNDNIPYTLSQYFQKYKTLLLSFKVKTAIPKDQQVKGNYGLVLKVPYLESYYNQETDATIQEVALRDYYFDINNMIGNPYVFSESTQQNFYISIDSNYDSSKNLELLAFVKDFYEEEGHADDIFITDISLKVVDLLTDANKNGYFLSIAAERGEFFNKGEYYTTKQLTPILKLNGKDTDCKHLPCYWFIEDSSINEESEEYSLRGGRGWRCLNEKKTMISAETGEKSFQYVTNKFTYTVNIDDVLRSRRYKCVLVNTDFSIVSSIIEIVNLQSDVEMKLQTSIKGTEYLANVGYVNLIASLKSDVKLTSDEGNIQYTWFRYDRAGNYLNSVFYDTVAIKDWDSTNKTYSAEITFPTSIVEQLNTIYCFIKIIDIDENGKYVEKDMGSVSINISTTDVQDFNLFIDNGDKLYKYDAYGNSPYVGNYDGVESSVVRNIEPISYRIIKRDGTEFTESEYAFCKTTWIVPKNSMIEVDDKLTKTEDDIYYYFKGNGRFDLNYSIASSYSFEKNNNIVQLKVEFSDMLLEKVSLFNFIKDGQSGTNGTKYSAEVVYEQPAGTPRILHMAYINNKGWYYFNYATKKLMPISDGIQFKAKVYKDGALITDSNQMTIKWDMFDSSKTHPCFNVENGVLSVKTDSNVRPYESCNIVRANITVKDGSVNNEVLYAHYPINVTYFEDSFNPDNLSTMPVVTGGYREVLYAADGTNPAFGTPIFTCKDLLIDIDNDTNELQYEYSWNIPSGVNLHLEEFNEDGKKSICDIRPNSKYDNIKDNNYFLLEITLNDYYKGLIAEACNQAEVKYNLAKNNYDLAQSKLNFLTQKASQIKVADWRSKLRAAEYLINHRAVCIGSATAALANIEDFYNVCEKYKDKILPIFDYQSFYNTSKIKIAQAIDALFAFGEVVKGTDSLSTLISLEDCIISFSSEQLLELKRVLISTAYSQVTAAKDVYNSNINAGSQSYQTHYRMLMLKPDEAYPFVELITLLRNTLTSIAPNYSALIDLLHDKNENFYTYSEINYKFFNTIINNLQLYFDVKEDSTAVANYYLKELTDAELEKQKLETEKEYTYWQGRVANTNLDRIICINPILLWYNRYEMSSINGWDGNRLYIDNNNQEYLYAPQVGAGHKDSDNTFTGIIIGDKRNTQDPTKKQTGLFGYHEGIQSIFLDASNGSATFGKQGQGQIIIEPGSGSGFDKGKAIIKSGNYNEEDKTGMKIDLTTPEIKWGNEKFKVDANGILTAVDGNFTGIITATGGNIAGWSLSSSKKADGTIKGTISSGNIVLDSEGSIKNTNEKWALNNDGSASFSNVNITGGGIKIGSGTQIFEVDRNGNVTLPSNAKITWGQVTGTDNIASKDYVTSQGYETAESIKSTVIDQNYIWSMKIKAGQIETGTITSTDGKTTKINLDDGTFTIGGGKLTWDKTTLTVTGKVNITNGGKIGTFNIVQTNDYSAIYSGTSTISSTTAGVYLGTDGIRNYKSTTANVTIKDGVITANGANISGILTAGSGSSIGGWTIGTNTITGGNTTLNSNGSITVGSNFSVNTSGVLTATSVNITSGTITGSKTAPLAFGSWTFNGGDLYCYNSTSQLSTGISATGQTAFATGIAQGHETGNWYTHSNLAITHSGRLNAKEIHITPGIYKPEDKDNYVEGTGQSTIGTFTFTTNSAEVSCGTHTSLQESGANFIWKVMYNFDAFGKSYAWGVCIINPKTTTNNIYQVVLGVQKDGTIVN